MSYNLIVEANNQDSQRPLRLTSLLVHSEEKISLLRLLVNAYPDETMAALLEDNVFHTAALWGNTDALEFLQDYAEISPAARVLSEAEKAELRCFSRPWRGATPLDYVHESLNEKGVRVQTQQDLLENGPFGKKWDLGLFDVTLLRERHLQCYRFLRTRGALHSDELEGYIIRFVMIYLFLYSSLSTWALVTFFSNVRTTIE